MHLDGQPIRSGVNPVSAAGEKRITTIEAIRGAPSAERRGARSDRGSDTAATAPALANAIFAATGSRIRKLPLAGVA